MIKREMLPELRKHLGRKEITLIVGPRQVGKTTLMKALEEELRRDRQKTLFLNMDNDAHRPHFSSQDALLQKIRLELGSDGGYVFIDEIQRREDAGLFLKGLYDRGLPYKFIVSGSGSLELKEHIHESLAGRKRLFELSPIAFDEFVHFRTGYRYAGKLSEFCRTETEYALRLLREYVTYGGYPAVVLEETLKEKYAAIDELFRSYIEKDIRFLLNVSHADAYGMLIKLLARRVGGIVNMAELAAMIGVSQPTLKQYLWYGEKTFILRRITPWHTNASKEIVKAPVMYFYDTGLCNYAAGRFNEPLELMDAGLVFQNMVSAILTERTRMSPAQLHFWRTKDKAEVDFVINAGTAPVPLEVKATAFARPNVERSLRSFIEKYSPEQAFVVNLSLQETIRVGTTDVQFIPWWRLYEIDFILPLSGRY